jgi:predicted nucleic acid-binding protein
MKVLIDTNLLFSAIIKPDGKIAEIILNSNFDLKIYGCYFSYIELFRHKDKILKLSKLDETELLEIMYQVIKKIEFFNEEQIPEEYFKKAFNLTFDVDEKDTVFIAMADYLKYPLWSGDLKLIEGLRKKEYHNILNTNELLAVLGK